METHNIFKMSEYTSTTLMINSEKEGLNKTIENLLECKNAVEYEWRNNAAKEGEEAQVLFKIYLKIQTFVIEICCFYCFIISS